MLGIKNKHKKKTNAKEVNSRKGVSRGLVNLFSGNFLSKENVIASLPFILFLMVLGIFYIANGYYTERMVRSIYKVGNEVKELRSEYITIKSELNYKSKQSQVAQATNELGIYESTVPPTKIVVDDTSIKNSKKED